MRAAAAALVDAVVHEASQRSLTARQYEDALARVGRLRGLPHRHPGQIAAMPFDLVPGEGGVRTARGEVFAFRNFGLLVFTAGASPTRIRLLLPVNTTDEELAAGFALLEKALRRVASDRGIAC